MPRTETKNLDSMTSKDSQNVYMLDGTTVVHRLRVGSIDVRSRIDLDEVDGQDLGGEWWHRYLRGVKPIPDERRGLLRTADLFSGPGGLALGHLQLVTEAGYEVVPGVVADADEEATRVYAANHGARSRYTESINSLIDYRVRGDSGGHRFAYPPEIIDDEVSAATRGTTTVLAGPPCQGHSNLNNRSRRTDPRNELYLTVPAFAVAAQIDIVIIENVPAVLNDASNVVGTAEELFRSEGYHVTTGMLKADHLGWPQTRKRHFMIARRSVPPLDLNEVAELLRDDPRSIWWAIADLENLDANDRLHQVANLSEENRARIAWLFENGEFDLPPSERPKSHQQGTTYTAVYGRLHRDRPAPTITGGFMSPGRGRFTHPTQQRTISAREAARLQGFPETYNFVPDPSDPPTKQKLAKWIGDAVPMPLGYAAALAAYGNGFPASGGR